MSQRIEAIEAASSADHHEKDAATFRDIIATLPRADISYWADVDFGGTWHGDKTHHLMEMLYDHNSVENEFLDSELEPLRQELVAAVNELMGHCALWGGRHEALPGNYYELGDAGWVRNNPSEGERYERFEQRREELGRNADRLVTAYDLLVRSARDRLPGA